MDGPHRSRHDRSRLACPATGGRASGTEHSAHRPQRWSCCGPSIPSGPQILQSGGDGAGRIGLWSCSKGPIYGHGGVPVADRRSPAAATAVGPTLCPGTSTRSDTASALVKAFSAVGARIGAAAASRLAADGPDPTSQTLLVSGERRDEVGGTNTVGKISTRAARKGSHRPRIGQLSRSTERRDQLNQSVRAPRGNPDQFGRIGAAGRERPLPVVGRQG